MLPSARHPQIQAAAEAKAAEEAKVLEGKKIGRGFFEVKKKQTKTVAPSKTNGKNKGFHPQKTRFFRY